MNIPDISNGPIFGAGYMPYFYQSGKFLVYNLPHTGLKSSYFGTPGGYDFTSDIVPKSSRPRGQTVEDIVRSGYFAVPKSESETAIIFDKNRTAKLGLDGMISQIRQRYENYEQNIYQIDQNICYAISSQFAVESARGGVRISSQEAYSLNKRLTELYLEQLHERNDLWRDISRLKLLLPEQAQNYLSSYRKVSILEDTESDTP